MRGYSRVEYKLEASGGRYFGGGSHARDNSLIARGLCQVKPLGLQSDGEKVLDEHPLHSEYFEVLRQDVKAALAMGCISKGKYVFGTLLWQKKVRL